MPTKGSIGVPFVPFGMSAASSLRNSKLVYQREKEDILKSGEINSENLPKIAKSYKSSASNLQLNLERENANVIHDLVNTKVVRFMPAVFFRVAHLFSKKISLLAFFLFTVSPLFWIIALYYFKVYSKDVLVEDIKDVLQCLT